MNTTRSWRFFLALVLIPGLVSAQIPLGEAINSSSRGGNTSPVQTDETPSGANLTIASPSQMKKSQVHVVGEVVNPGTFMLSVPARVTAALQAAGGIKPSGSNRRVSIRREARPERIVDLLELSTTGDVAQDPYVFDNDIVFVPLRQNTVVIRGPVKVPGQYELVGEHTLADTIRLAGGYTTGVAKFRPIQIIRYSNDKDDKTVLDVPFDEEKLAATPVQNGDVISLPHVFTSKNPPVLSVGYLPNDNFDSMGSESRVFVIGGVKAAGTFPYNPQYRVPQYLAAAGGGSLRLTNSVTITRIEGQVVHTNVNDNSVPINPGDTIKFGESQVSTEFWIGFLATLASVSLSAVAILRP
jgi:protein involved in polysaccharide export with SLBB domain